MERLSFLLCYSVEPEFLLSTKGRVKKLRELVKNERKGRASCVSNSKLFYLCMNRNKVHK